MFDEDIYEGDGWWGVYSFLDSDEGELYNLYHIGSFHLSDIIADGNYTGVTLTPVISGKFGNTIRIGTDKCNEPSILYEYTPTLPELKALLAALTGQYDDFFFPVDVVLTRGEQSATITLHLYYWDSMFLFW